MVAEGSSGDLQQKQQQLIVLLHKSGFIIPCGNNWNEKYDIHVLIVMIKSSTCRKYCFLINFITIHSITIGTGAVSYRTCIRSFCNFLPPAPLLNTEQLPRKAGGHTHDTIKKRRHSWENMQLEQSFPQSLNTWHSPNWITVADLCHCRHSSGCFDYCRRLLDQIQTAQTWAWCHYEEGSSRGCVSSWPLLECLHSVLGTDYKKHYNSAELITNKNIICKWCLHI